MDGSGPWRRARHRGVRRDKNNCPFPCIAPKVMLLFSCEAGRIQITHTECGGAAVGAGGRGVNYSNDTPEMEEGGRDANLENVCFPLAPGQEPPLSSSDT